ncbi:hypothetical protein [Pseudoalteromonas arctica]|uniref:Uncharacterized protein n=1 Tax=Pseudoalteromonas arctica TaxID=394751 RepID=A0A7Y0DT60_9GAMM|nr:hypothetical protein [Pseudoalteromonas arctica]NMM40231.1 hypothetical protein [Pseudoalteromonas arctica]
MFKSLSQLLFMIILLVAFVGQTMAYSLMTSYDSISELQTSTQLQPFSTEHSSAKSASEDDCCDVECCENECICPANACASMLYLYSNLPLSELVVISESLNLLSTQATFFTATSLYRPPIFTSEPI